VPTEVDGGSYYISDEISALLTHDLHSRLVIIFGATCIEDDRVLVDGDRALTDSTVLPCADLSTARFETSFE
jgi:hypothetical protein